MWLLMCLITAWCVYMCNAVSELFTGSYSLRPLSSHSTHIVRLYITYVTSEAIICALNNNKEFSLKLLCNFECRWKPQLYLLNVRLYV